MKRRSVMPVHWLCLSGIPLHPWDPGLWNIGPLLIWPHQYIKHRTILRFHAVPPNANSVGLSYVGCCAILPPKQRNLNIFRVTVRIPATFFSGHYDVLDQRTKKSVTSEARAKRHMLVRNIVQHKSFLPSLQCFIDQHTECKVGRSLTMSKEAVVWKPSSRCHWVMTFRETELTQTFPVQTLCRKIEVQTHTHECYCLSIHGHACKMPTPEWEYPEDPIQT